MQLEAQQASLDADYRVDAGIKIRSTAEHLDADFNFLGSVGAPGETLVYSESKKLSQAGRPQEGGSRKNAAEGSVDFVGVRHP